MIVPVYNPGSHIDDCIESLLGQSLPPEEYEVIFVDDGSTDETPARLDALAAEHEHVRVGHIPNSGWPGRPRNVGLDMAAGDYVYFVDNDDWVGDQALERLHGMAVQDEADIVVGKVVGHGKQVPRQLFKQNVHGERFKSTLSLLGLLTPHKLFRRAFLLEHGLRFPEGRRRLEDHVFVVDAYFRAERISVLADYACYHWVVRDPEASASLRPFEAEGYFENVREVLDIVESHTEPGPFRDRVLMHWYRGKMLGRVGGGGFLARDDAHRRQIFDAVHRLALERYDDGVHERLPFNLRVRSRLLRAGRYDDLIELSRMESGLKARIKLRHVKGDGSHLVIKFEMRVPTLAFARSGERVRWAPPESIAFAFAEQHLDVTDEIGNSHAQVWLFDPATGTDHLLPASTTVRLRNRRGGRVQPVLVVTARVTPTTAAGGAPLPAGRWEVRATAHVVGFAKARRLRTRRKTPLVLTAIPPARIVKGTRAPRGAAAEPPRRRGLLRRRAGGGAAARG